MVDLAFSGTKGYPGQVKRHSLPFQEEAVLKYLVVPLTFALDCTYLPTFFTRRQCDCHSTVSLSFLSAVSLAPVSCILLYLSVFPNVHWSFAVLSSRILPCLISFPVCPL